MERKPLVSMPEAQAPNIAGSVPGVPRHVAIIMDGNGRWAAARGQPRVAGHKSGLEAVRVTIQECVKRKIGALTIFAFSSENWRRPADEVDEDATLGERRV